MRRSKAEGTTAGCSESRTDRATLEPGRSCFHADSISWLVGEAIARINADEGEGAAGFARAIELLARLGAADSVGAMLHAVPREDVALRWSLLYVLAETVDPAAATIFARTALERIDVEPDRRACESVYDGEVLVRAMAIEGLAKLAAEHREAIDLLYKVVEAQIDPALRVEAVKGILAEAPAEAKRLKELLPEELHFALTLKKARIQSLIVEYETAARDAVRPMPGLEAANPRPAARNCNCC